MIAGTYKERISLGFELHRCLSPKMVKLYEKQEEEAGDRLVQKYDR